jgi:hypothetical protein
VIQVGILGEVLNTEGVRQLFKVAPGNNRAAKVANLKTAIIGKCFTLGLGDNGNTGDRGVSMRENRDLFTVGKGMRGTREDRVGRRRRIHAEGKKQRQLITGSTRRRQSGGGIGGGRSNANRGGREKESRRML